MVVDGVFTEEKVVYEEGNVKIIESNGNYAKWWECYVDGIKVWDDGYIE